MPDCEFSQLVDLEQVRQLLESHHRLSGMAYGLLDTNENALVAVGWQDICTRFHRVHPVTCARCRESDAFIKAHLQDASEELLEYRCKNNMIDIAMPIIIDGKHRATFITGQFFYKDDPPDREFFVNQAQALGFNAKEYLAALDKVPLYSREHIRGNVLFLHNVMRNLAELGLKNLRLAREMEKRKRVEEALNRRLMALTEPLETADVTFEDLFNIEDIQKIQDAFAGATNVASIITKPDGTPITEPSGFCWLCQGIIRKTEKGRAACFHSDAAIGRQNPGDPIVQPCLSCGLWDAGACITVGGKHIANWLIGQVKNEAIDEEKVLRYAPEIGADEAEFRSALREVPVMSVEQFGKIAEVLSILANELSHRAYQNVQQARFITMRQQAENQRLEQLRFLESMDRVNRAIQETYDLEQMMKDVLDAVMSIFDCDRAFLQYPCDPEAPQWWVPMERTKPEYPGVLQLGRKIEMSPGIATAFRAVIDDGGPVQFGPGMAHELPPEGVEQFGFKSMLCMALHPKVGRTWQFGLHQCSSARQWTPVEVKLFQEIGRRLTDGLSTLLAYRKSRDRELKLLDAQRIARVGGLEFDAASQSMRLTGELWEEIGAPAGRFAPAAIYSACLPPENWERLLAAVKDSLSTGSPYEAEFEMRSAGGRSYWMFSRGEPVVDEQSGALGVRGACIDITERRERTAALQRLNRELRALSDCNQALLHVEDEQELLGKICQIICEVGGYRFAWVGYAGNGAEKSIRNVASAGVEDGYLEGARLTWADTEYGRGASGTALRTGKSAAVEDFATTPEASPWREAALQRGYRSAVSLPLKDSAGNTFGILSIYSTEAGAFTSKEVRLLEGLADNLAFGIGVLRARAALQLAEQERQEHVKLLENLDRINRAIQGAASLEQMMSDVLDTTLSVFGCGRVALVHPCDPGAPIWQVMMERTVPECARSFLREGVFPMGADVAEVFRTVLEASGPVWLGGELEHPMPARTAESCGAQSQLAMAIHPQTGEPWMFVLQQCARPRTWTQHEERLFEEIGRRICDSLSSLLFYRDLRDSELRYRQIVDTANEGIWMVDLRGVTSFVNAKMAGMLGYDVEEFSGHTVSDFMFEEDVPDHLQQMEKRRKGEPATYERRFRRKDGEPVWTLAAATPIFDDERHFRGGFSMYTDITARKRAQEELRRYKDGLELLVEARTVELMEAVEKLERSNRDLDEFAYIASHDLKEPLRGIHNYVSFLRDDYGSRLDEEGRNYLGRLQRLAERLTALIDGLLAYSRLSNRPLPMETVDMEAVLNDVAVDLEAPLETQGVELRRVGRLPSVKGNAARIGEVFQNLIANAAKYNDKAEKWVEVGCDTSGPVPVFYVRDNGIGIPEQHREKIFRIFKRLHEQSKYGGGTGVGLTIVKKIVERHGGRIWLESTPGEGTAFYFTLSGGA
jgi:PAS domain S-box-containing protein